MPPQEPQNPAPPTQQPNQPMPAAQPAPTSGQPASVAPVTTANQPIPAPNPTPSAGGNIGQPIATPPLQPPAPGQVPVATVPPAPVSTNQPAPSTQPVPPQPTMPSQVPVPPTNTVPPAPGANYVQPAPVAAPQQPVITSNSYKEGKKVTKILLFVGIGIAALVVLAGGFFAVAKLTGGIKLVKYENSKFEILYPKGYEQKEDKQDGMEFVSFTEPEGDDADKSVVTVSLLGKGEDASSENKKATLDELEKNINELAKNESIQITNSKTSRLTMNGEPALKVTGNYAEDNDSKSRGDVVMVISFSGDMMYMNSILINKTDPGLKKQSDKIVQSFKLK